MFFQIIQKINEGGPAFIYPIVLLLAIITIQFVKAIKNPRKRAQYQGLIINAGWLAFAWGMFGKSVGLIIAFDTFKTIPLGELTAQELAGGLRMAMLIPLVSLLTFSFSRLYALILNRLNLDL